MPIFWVDLIINNNGTSQRKFRTHRNRRRTRKPRHRPQKLPASSERSPKLHKNNMRDPKIGQLFNRINRRIQLRGGTREITNNQIHLDPQNRKLVQ